LDEPVPSHLGKNERCRWGVVRVAGEVPALYAAGVDEGRQLGRGAVSVEAEGDG
jgi:hypothetical protein